MFDETLAKHALRQALLSAGFDRFMASKFVTGRNRPSLKTAARIEEATGIPASAWMGGPPLKEAWEQVLRRAS